MLQVFVAEPDESIPIFVAGPGWAHRDSFLPVIQEKLNDAKFSTSELLRLISAEIARLILEIAMHQQDAKASFRLRASMGQIKTLRVLADSVRRMEGIRKKEDVLNLDGPKFIHVFGELLKCFEQALREALGHNGEMAAQSTMRQFRDIVAMREPELRREVERMG